MLQLKRRQPRPPALEICADDSTSGAVAYRRGHHLGLFVSPYRGSPAGGGYSTAGDLLRFSQALSDGKLLSPAMFKEATRLQSGWQGFGFEVVGDAALTNYGHGGMAPGMNAHFRVFPHQGYVIIVLSNFDPPAAGLVYSFLHDRMPVVD